MNIKRIPKHIGIIPDGNRRWAEAHGLAKEDGYAYGIEPGKKLFEIGFDLGIQEVSVYAFTQENTHRNRKQIVAFQNACVKFIDWVKDKDVSILVVGDSDSTLFPEKLKKYTEPEKFRNEKKRLNFLVNYSWKWDLSMISFNTGNKPQDKQNILKGVGSHWVSRIDLIIRWGGRRRLSGFLPLQSAYADIFVIDTFWPDFKPQQFFEALHWYETQEITLGG
jgi:undecaprenyl diphosphate synthase